MSASERYETVASCGVFSLERTDVPDDRAFFIPFFSGVCLDPEINVSCRNVILAVEAPEVERLLGLPRQTGSRGEHCLYFAAEEAPLREPFLVINAEGVGPINNLSVPSLVAPSYAPPGRSLVSVTVIDDHLVADKDLEESVRKQLMAWYGDPVRAWTLLKTCSIAHALPDQPAPAPNPKKAVGEMRPGIFVCGEYRSLPSIQWALLSGRLAADKALAGVVQRGSE
jgi:hypothetical protein